MINVRFGMQSTIRCRRVCYSTLQVHASPVVFSFSCLSAARSGSHYYDVARNTSLLLLRNVASAGLLTCSPEAALALNLHRVFMPHGLGHLIGLDVHDPYVYPHRLQPPQPLQHGMVLTCEPGIYFVPSLIKEALSNTEKAACLDRESVLRMQNSVGGKCPISTTAITARHATAASGVRIEEVIVVQTMGPPVVLSQPR